MKFESTVISKYVAVRRKTGNTQYTVPAEAVIVWLFSKQFDISYTHMTRGMSWMLQI